MRKTPLNRILILGGLFFCLFSVNAFAENYPPNVGAISPSSGSISPGTPITFTATFNDSNSWQDIRYANLLINTSRNGAKCFYGCYIQNTNKLYIRNDDNTAWVGGYAPGSSRIIANSYAELDCSQTTVSGNGTELTVAWNITFKSSFVGVRTKNCYLYVKDDSGAYSGWAKKGAWFVTIPMGASNFNIEGIILGSWSKGEYQTPDAEQALANLAKTGANYAGILGTWYMDTTPSDGEYSKSNIIYSHPQKTPSDSDLIQAIQTAKRFGRKVCLKLHIRVILGDDPWADAWAGSIRPEDSDTWFNYYTQFVEHYARICQDNKVDILCFGTELNSMTTNPEYSAKWDSVIDSIKAEYSGKLTFSSNMYFEYENIPFWPRCDYLGIGPYFSLTDNAANPDLDTIIDGWVISPVDGKLIEKLEAWRAQYNKPVIFTEIGYCSVDTAAYRPWKGTAGLPENWPLQKRCYDALFLSLQKKPWFKGAFIWDWLCGPNAGTTGLERKEYTPQNKDAENSLINFYFGINPDKAAYIKIVDGNDNEIPDGTVIYVGRHKNLYAKAYNSNNEILGYVSCAWSVSGSGGTVKSNKVGYAMLKSTTEGALTVTAAAANGRMDSLNLIFVQRYLRVPSEYPAIQSAIDAALEGDIILVEQGEYNEAFIHLKPGVELISVYGAKVTIINGGLTIHEDADENTVISGFTITNPEGDGICGRNRQGYYGDSKSMGSPVIKNNIIKNNSDAGILIWHSSPKVYNNIIEGNSKSGINNSGGAVEIINNVIINNNAVRGGGIYILYSDGKIFNNIIVNNHATEYGGGMKGWENGAGFKIGYNDVWDNTADLGEPNYGTCPSGPGAIEAGPLFTDSDYHLSAASSCKDAGHPATKYNDLDATRNDMGIYGGRDSF